MLVNEFNCEAIALIPFANVTQQDFDVWIEEALTRIQSSLVNRDLNLLSAVFEQAKRWRWTDRNDTGDSASEEPATQRQAHQRVGNLTTIGSVGV